MITVTMNMKQGFFDRDRVIDAIGRVEARAMSRALAFVRRTAQRDVLRRRKRVSAAGQPPSVRSSHPVASLRTIWFAYESRQHTGVVGPLKLNMVSNNNSASAVPNLLEFGGTVVTRREQYVPIQKGRRVKGRRGQVNSTKKYETIPKGTVMRYQSRPFMAEALDREIKKGTIPGAWAGVVGG